MANAAFSCHVTQINWEEHEHIFPVMVSKAKLQETNLSPPAWICNHEISDDLLTQDPIYSVDHERESENNDLFIYSCSYFILFFLIESIFQNLGIIRIIKCKFSKGNVFLELRISVK